MMKKTTTISNSMVSEQKLSWTVGQVCCSFFIYFRRFEIVSAKRRAFNLSDILTCSSQTFVVRIWSLRFCCSYAGMVVSVGVAGRRRHSRFRTFVVSSGVELKNRQLKFTREKLFRVTYSSSVHSEESVTILIIIITTTVLWGNVNLNLTIRYIP